FAIRWCERSHAAHSFRSFTVSVLTSAAGDRQPHRELGAATLEVVRADVSPVRLRDRLSDREAEPGAVPHRVLPAIEALEEANLRAFRQTRARVAHAHDDRAVGALPADLDRRTSRRVLNRVVEEVEDELRELVRISADRGERA